MNRSEVIARALEGAGGHRVVADAMNLSPETVRLWRVHGRVPAARLIEFERVTGVPREVIRPDLYRRTA